MNEHTIRAIARVCHEVNNGYCMAMGFPVSPPWEEAPDWQQESVINGVKFHLENPSVTPRDSHDNWYHEKARQGWTWGPVKDADEREHPCMVPYDDLPVEQRAKDFIFSAVIKALADAPPVR